MACNKDGSCEGCKKKTGLPIVPVRFAFIPTYSRGPKLNEQFKMKENIALHHSYQYALRQLREGYLYVYCPKDNQGNSYPNPWKGYIVTDKGFFYPLNIPLDGPGEPVTIADKDAEKDDWAPCVPADFGANAKFITVPEDAGDVWICFSEVQWTKAVWERFDPEKSKKFKEPAPRDNLMHKIEVKKWLDGNKAINQGLAINELINVLEYTPDLVDHAHDFSTHPLNWMKDERLYDWKSIYEEFVEIYEKELIARFGKEEYEKIVNWTEGKDNKTWLLYKNHVELLAVRIGKKHELKDMVNSQGINPRYHGLSFTSVMNACELVATSDRTKGKSMVVALEDPVGITKDIALQMIYSEKHFFTLLNSDDKYKKKLIMEGNMQLVKSAVSMAEYQNYSFKLKEIGEQIRESLDQKTTEEKAGETYVNEILPRKQVETGEAKAVFNKHFKMIKDMETRGTKVWEEDYLPHIQVKLTEFNNQYKKEVKDFSDNTIKPLEKSHLGWFKSDSFANQMKFHYDENVLECGIKYTSVITECMLGTQDKLGCFNAYLEMFDKGNVNDKTGLLLRATSFNYQPSIVALQKLAAEIVDSNPDKQLSIWDATFSNLSTLFTFQKDNALVDSATIVMEKFFDMSGSVIGKSIDKALKNGDIAVGKSQPLLVPILGKLIGKPIITTMMTYTEEAGYIFLDNRANQVIKTSGQTSANSKIRKTRLFPFLEGVDTKKALEAEEKVLANLPPNEQVMTNTIIIHDKEVYTQQRKALNSNPLFSGSGKEDKIRAALWHSIVNLDEQCSRIIKPMKESVRFALPGVMGTLGSILNFVVAGSIAYGLSKSYSASAYYSNAARAVLSFVGGMATAVETTAHYTEKRILLRYGQEAGKTLAADARLLRVNASRVAAYAAWAYVGVDAVQAVQSYIEGHSGLAIAHAVSAVVGFGIIEAVILITGVVKAAFASGILVGLMTSGLFLGVFGIAIVILTAVIAKWVMEETKKKDIKTWLSRGIFGDNTLGKPYNLWPEAEMEEFEKVMASS